MIGDNSPYWRNRERSEAEDAGRQHGRAKRRKLSAENAALRAQMATLTRAVTRAVADLRHSQEGRTATGLVERVIQTLERLVTPGAEGRP